MNTNKFICHGCVAEPYLQRQIRNLGVESECSYCLALPVPHKCSLGSVMLVKSSVFVA